MAIDIVARGLALSVLDDNGKIASEKLPTIDAPDGAQFYPVGQLTNPALVQGKTAEEILMMMLYGIANPTFTDPSVNVRITSTALIADMDCLLEGVIEFDRGSINPAYGTSGYRAGRASSAEVSINNDAPFVVEPDLNGNIVLQHNFIPRIGDNGIVIKQYYEEGEQPLNSIGQPYGSPLAAGSVTVSAVVKGVAPIYSPDGEVLDFEVFEDELGFGYATVSAAEAQGQAAAADEAKNYAQTAQSKAEAAQAAAEAAKSAAEDSNTSATAIANAAKTASEAATAASNAATQAVAGLHAIATSGNVNDLVQTAGDILVFNCGSATTVI